MITPVYKNRCCERVSVSTWRDKQCERAGVVEVDGKHYCRQHSPEAQAARQAKSAAHYTKLHEQREAPFKALAQLKLQNANLSTALRSARALLDSVAFVAVEGDTAQLLVEIDRALEDCV